MSAKLFSVQIGRMNVACFADSSVEAIGRACDVINGQYDLGLDTDTVIASVKVLSIDDVGFNDEVHG